jgi:hypothetical protein
MHSRRLHLVLASILLAAFAVAAHAQKPAEAWAEWESLSPDNEEFTVLMPKNPTTESTTFPFHKMELNARLYMATSNAGPVLAIASLSGIKSDPAQYTEFARFNSYIDAFKSFFPAKVRSKETLVKMVLMSSRPFHGHTGRSYKLTLGDLNGSVNAFVTRKRFYAIVSLNTKKDDALEEKFLSSFELPERPPDAKKTTAEGEGDANAQPGEKQNQAQSEGEVAQPNGAEGNTEQATNAAPNQAPEKVGSQVPDRTQANQKPKGPLAGGMLNSKAIYLPQPEVPSGEASDRRAGFCRRRAARVRSATPARGRC